MRQITTVGIEYTYTPIDGDEYTSRDVYNEIKSKFNRAYLDSYHLEVPSPIHKNRKSLRKFYTKLSNTIKNYPMRSHVKNYGTGGGHIHLGLQSVPKKLRNKFIRNMVADAANRPYLNWIFNEWCDQWNANSLISENYKEIIGKINSNHRYQFVYVQSSWETIYLPKFTPIYYNSDYNTLEFRFFDAQKDYSDVKDHVDFAMAYFKRILKKTKRGDRIYIALKYKNQIKNYSNRNALKEFRELLKELNLDSNRYQKYINRNFKERMRSGKKV